MSAVQEAEARWEVPSADLQRAQRKKRPPERPCPRGAEDIRRFRERLGAPAAVVVRRPTFVYRRAVNDRPAPPHCRHSTCGMRKASTRRMQSQPAHRAPTARGGTRSFAPPCQKTALTSVSKRAGRIHAWANASWSAETVDSDHFPCRPIHVDSIVFLKLPRYRSALRSCHAFAAQRMRPSPLLKRPANDINSLCLARSAVAIDQQRAIVIIDRRHVNATFVEISIVTIRHGGSKPAAQTESIDLIAQPKPRCLALKARPCDIR